MKRIIASTLTLAAAAAVLTASPASAAPKTYQAWLYPGPVGSQTCSAPAAYGDGRVQQGVLKAEYYTIDANGTPARLNASSPDYACNGYSPANAADVKAHSAKQFVTVSLGGIDKERKLTGTPAKRAAAISTLTAFAGEIGFTGIDIDFENYGAWTPTDQANYYAFITELAAALHDEGLQLQVEGPAETDAGFDYGEILVAGADQVVMMAYDLQYSSEPGTTCLPFTPFDWLEERVTAALDQIPGWAKSRLVVGLPSQGYQATNQCQTIRGNLSYNEMTTKPGFSSDPAVIESRRDPASGEIRWSSGNTFYDYVDRKALDQKLAVVRNLGVTNVSVWVLGGGNHWFS